MKNIIFDLGGVLFARNPNKTTPEFKEFFSFIADKKMPEFWEEYDRGTRTLEQTIDHLAEIKGCSRETVKGLVANAIDMQEEIEPTANLICELKTKGYKLYVLSNMAKEFIAMLRSRDIYRNFDGDVVSCEELTVKPERKIYEILLERFELDPAESLFIDDRPANIEVAKELGINGYIFNRYAAEQSCQEIREILYK